MPQWEPQPFVVVDDAQLAGPEGFEMSYASYDPGYQLEPPYGAYYEAPYAAAVPESVPLIIRSEDPLEDTAGSSSAAAELAAYFAAGSALGYSAYSMLTVSGEERPAKVVAVGAAGVGAFLGVWVFGSVTAAGALAVACAYGSTRNDTFRKAGSAAAAAYDKIAEIDEQYDVAKKVKTATDQTVLAAQNLNKNYGLTAKVDKQLQLTERSSAVTSKFQKVTDAVDDFKMKATNPPQALLKAGEP
jgi:hypothetical protein